MEIAIILGTNLVIILGILYLRRAVRLEMAREFTNVALILAGLQDKVDTKPALAALPAQFMCHYCGALFPVTDREVVGNYNYCKEHGRKRKEKLNPCRTHNH